LLSTNPRHGTGGVKDAPRVLHGFRPERVFHSLTVAGAEGLERMRPARAEPADWWVELGSALQDVFLVWVNLYVACLTLLPASRFGGGRFTALLSQRESLTVFFLSGTFTLLAFTKSKPVRLQHGSSVLAGSLAVGQVAAAVTVLLLVFGFISRMEIIRPIVIVSAGLLNLLTLTGWRLLKRAMAGRRYAAGGGTRNVLIVGAGRVGRAIAQFLEENKHLGCEVHGFLDEKHRSDVRVLGRIDALSQVARAHFIDEVVITISSPRELVSEAVAQARRNRLDVKVVPDMYQDFSDGPSTGAVVERMGEYPVLVLHREPVGALGSLVKRALDIVLASLTLVFLSPLFLAIAAAIKFDSRGPVLYRSPRLGKKGRSFACLKFRTMVPEADLLKSKLRHLNERQGPFFKLADDPRITRVGRWLRRYSLDELPQFWNVLSGDMSLVGPRPHPIDDCAQYRLDQLRRLDVTPGITGLWQITSRRDPSFDKNMLLDLEYIKNWSPWRDIKILLKTLPVVLKADGQ